MLQQWGILSVFLFLFGTINAQTTPEFLPVKTNYQWGYIDLSGSVKIQPKYDYASGFSKHGLATVRKSWKYGLIDTTGKQVLPCRFDRLNVLSKDRIAIFERGQWALSDLVGKAITSFKYDQIYSITAHVFAAREKRTMLLMDDQGQLVDSTQFDTAYALSNTFIAVKRGEDWGVLDTKGKWLLPLNCAAFRQVSPTVLFYRKAQLWGAINATGEKLLESEYDHFIVEPDRIKIRKRGVLWGVFNPWEEKVDVPASFETAHIIAENPRFSITYAFGKKGLVRNDGVEILPPEYTDIVYSQADYFMILKDTLRGKLDQDGEVVFKAEWDRIQHFQNGVALLTKGQKSTVADATGKILSRPKFDNVLVYPDLIKAYRGKEMTTYSLNGRGRVTDTQVYQNVILITVAGNPPLRPLPQLLNQSGWFWDPQAVAWGLRDTTGRIVIPPSFRGIQINEKLGVTFTANPRRTTDGIYIAGSELPMVRVFGVVDHKRYRIMARDKYLSFDVGSFDSVAAAAVLMDKDHDLGFVNAYGVVRSRGYKYVGQFKDSLIRVQKGGRLYDDLFHRKETIDTFDHFLGRLMTNANLNARWPALIRWNRRSQTKDDKFLMNDVGRWGFVGADGRLAIPVSYQHAEDFKYGTTIVKSDQKWGMINRENETVLAFDYDFLRRIQGSNGQLVELQEKRRTYGYFNANGHVSVKNQYEVAEPFSYERALVMKDDVWGFVDKHGKEVALRYGRARSFSDGLAAVRIGRKWGFIDTTGVEVVTPEFKVVSDFYEGRASFRDKGKLGFINAQGDPVIPAQFEHVESFCSGLAVVKFNGEFGAIDKTGNWKIEPKFHALYAVDQWAQMVAKKGEHFGLINTDGTRILPFRFDQIMQPAEGLRGVKKNGVWGFVDRSGQWIIDPQFDDCAAFQEGKAAIQIGMRWGFIDSTGQRIVDPLYDEVYPFTNGLAVVKINNRYGVIDSKGQYIITPSRRLVLPISEGLMVVKNASGKFYYVDRNGFRAFNEEYEAAQSFRNGLAIVKRKRGYGVIDKNGRFLIDPRRDALSFGGDDRIRYLVKNLKGVAKSDGTIIIPATYEHIERFSPGIFRVFDHEKVGYFRLDGSWLWEPNN